MKTETPPNRPGKTVPRLLKSWVPLTLNFCITMLGFLAAYSCFRLLAPAQPPVVEVAKKDTLLVQLVGMPAFLAGRSGADTPLTNRLSSMIPGQVTDSTGQRLSSFRVPPPVPVTPAMISAAAASYKLQQPGRPWRTVLGAGILVLLVLAYVYYQQLPSYSLEMSKNVDPEDLTSMFEKFSGPIQLLGNPRKIKRLSNKIRFQYYYLSARDMATPSNLECLFLILLLFEQKDFTSLLAGETPKKTELTEQVFIAFLAEHSIKPGDARFIKVMYSLNMDSFF